MVKKINYDNNLTSEEKNTSVAYKLLSKENGALKRSLKKTQDSLEDMRKEKFDHEKENAILNHKQRTVFWIECCKFSSSAGIGFATSYFFQGSIEQFLTIGIPSVIIFFIALFFSNK
jgi:hypothetical protein